MAVPFGFGEEVQPGHEVPSVAVGVMVPEVMTSLVTAPMMVDEDLIGWEE